MHFYILITVQASLPTSPQSHCDRCLSPSLPHFMCTQTHFTCSGEGGGALIDRRRVSEWKADNYIFYSSLKGQTHIAVIGIFTRQPPRYNKGERERGEEKIGVI